MGNLCSSNAPVGTAVAKEPEEVKEEEPPVVIKVLTPLEITRKLHTAIRWNKDFDDIKDLLEPEGACDFVDPQNGNAPIHIAAQNGHSNVVEILLEKKCNINAQNLKGNTALHMAIGYDYYDAAVLLLQGGIDAEMKNCAGFAGSTGLEGDKSLAAAQVVCANDAGEFSAALVSLKKQLPRGMKKEMFMKLGLKMKKANPAAWNEKGLQAEFTSLLHNWEPEPEQPTTPAPAATTDNTPVSSPAPAAV
jgi:ankyrin repeat protein